MKRVLLYILLMMTGLFFTACDAFFLPPFERTNPYDSEAPVAPVASFQAKTIDVNTIELSWTLPEERAPSSLLIVRNSTAQPESPEDGDVINSGQLVPAADGVFTDAEDISENSSYWYAVWSIYSEDAEDIVIANIEDYVLVGPLYESAGTVTETVTAYTSIDGSIDNTDVKDFNGTAVWIDNSAMPSVGLFGFTLPDEIKNKGIHSCQLIIKNDIAIASDSSLAVYRILEDWDETTITYSHLTTAGTFHSSTAAATILVPNGTPEDSSHSADITEQFIQLVNSGNNYGFLIEEQNSTSIGLVSRDQDINEAARLLITYYTDDF